MITHSNKYTILIVILSVLLAISLIAGTTFAWFISTDVASRNITLGDPVELNIVDATGTEIVGDGHNLPITIAGSRLMPGMQINVLSRVKFTQSNTPAILRAKIEVSITNATATQQEIDTLQAQLQQDVNGIVVSSGLLKWVYNASDEWWYFVGSNSVLAPVEYTELQRINTEGVTDESRMVTLINSAFTFPSNVGNEFANALITFNAVFQGLQGYLPAYDGELTDENELIGGFYYRRNRISNVYEIFNEAFGG